MTHTVPNFEFIPVLDLMGSTTVYAVQGNRATYRPLQTPLAANSDPVTIAKALIKATGSNILYIADLDAILGQGTNDDAIAHIHTALPHIALWIDPGITTIEQCKNWLTLNETDLILGSETLANADVFAALTPTQQARCILSLDFDKQGFRGDNILLKTPGLWPDRVIVMTLDKVGSNAGPDLARLKTTISHAGPRNIYAAGGMRSIDDANTLANTGAKGILLASALHKQSITQKEIAAFP